ncbi:MAG: glycosyltransferase family 2 protein [Eubacteriales bacterium]
MKLIIQIPCYNEEETLPITFADLPQKIDGVDTIEYLIIDDGSQDRTIEIAKEIGVNHIVRQKQNAGLAKGFMAGIDACLRLGADIIVNTDGDNQYCGHDIPKLIQPILRGEADFVVGDRETDKIEHFSSLKKKLQKLGSGVVRRASEANVTDTTSGFRAYSREAAMRLNVISDYSYTLETIILAGRQKIAVANVPIRTNEKLRESRLFKSMGSYIKKSGATIVRTYAQVKPLKIFGGLSAVMLLAGLVVLIRYLFFYFSGDGSGHVQSVLLGVMLLVIGFQVGVFGLLADAVAANRKINEELLYRVKKMEYDKNDDA